jgi:hypothetical protein
MKTLICQSCNSACSSLIDGVSVCPDDEATHLHSEPPCMTKYIGYYQCNICCVDYNVKQEGCVYYKDDDADEVTYSCLSCVDKLGSKTKSYGGLKYNKMVGKFTKIQRAYPHDYESMESEINKLGVKFCCNECVEHIPVVFGLFIYENRNLCRECFEKN